MEQNYVNPEVQLRRIDRWVKYFTMHTWPKTVLFIVAYLEAVVSPLVPEIVLAAMLTYRKDLSWVVMSTISAVGSTVGALTLYIIAYHFYGTIGQQVVDYFNADALMAYAGEVFIDNAFVSLFLAAFTPLPDRIFSFAAGIFEVAAWIVVVAVFSARLFRAALVGYFAYHYGAEARGYVLRHSKTALSVVVVLIALYLAVRYLGILSV